MKGLLKYAGVILVAIGALLLIIPGFMNTITNPILITAAFLFVIGIVAHIILNKYISE